MLEHAICLKNCPEDLAKASSLIEMLREVSGPEAVDGFTGFNVSKSQQVRRGWLQFTDDTLRDGVLQALHERRPSLGAIAHKAKDSAADVTPKAPKQTPFESAAPRFQNLLGEIRPSGAIGNTLVYSNIPMNVDVASFEELIMGLVKKHALAQASDLQSQFDNVRPIRTRANPTNSKKAQHMYFVFANVAVSRIVFCCTERQKVTFRSGNSTTLRPTLFDDSKDRDEMVRRERAKQLAAESAQPEKQVGIDANSRDPRKRAVARQAQSASAKRGRAAVDEEASQEQSIAECMRKLDKALRASGRPLEFVDE